MKIKPYLLVTYGLVTLLAANISTDTQAQNKYSINDVWEAYDGFNHNLLDSEKFIYKTNTSFERAVDRWNGAAAIWCQPMYWDMAMNAWQLAEQLHDTQRAQNTRN